MSETDSLESSSVSETDTPESSSEEETDESESYSEWETDTPESSSVKKTDRAEIFQFSSLKCPKIFQNSFRLSILPPPREYRGKLDCSLEFRLMIHGCPTRNWTVSPFLQQGSNCNDNIYHR